MNRFLVPQEALSGEVAPLPALVTRQLTRVLRMRPGAQIVLFGGDGREALAEVTRLQGEEGEARLLEWRTPAVELPRPLWIGLSLLKGEKLEWTLQKLTELGAARITLMQTERVIVDAPASRWERRRERYETIIREAVEQSGRVRVPVLDAPLPLVKVLALAGQSGLPVPPLILTPGDAPPLLRQLAASDQSALLLIGPEGGFTAAEVQSAIERGAVRSSLGRRVLRAETAAITATALAAAAMETPNENG